MMFASIRRVRPAWLVAALVVISTTMTILAMRRTSSTFDEIAPIAVGAHGWETGDWSMMTRFPPVMQYLYGIPGYLSHPVYPKEMPGRNYYEFARSMLWKSGNDGEAMIFRARLIAALFVGALVVLTYAVARAWFGTATGLLAASIVAFLPDVLAHGGIAYNDVPLATVFLAGVWAIDHAVRRPTLRNGLIAGLVASLALGIKHSALALGPTAFLLVLAALISQPNRRAWLRSVLPAIGVALLAGYLLQVALYRGDFGLHYLVDGTNALSKHLSEGHKASHPTQIVDVRPGWYFFPLTFIQKTPAAFHLLLIVAAVGGVLALRSDWRRKLLAGNARAPLAALIVFVLILLRSNLVIGFRYALPTLPLLAILAAAGCMVLWPRRRAIRAGIIALVVLSAVSTLSFYPYFIAYSSEYPPNRDHAYEVLGDSSLDWGQGLIALREFMKEEGVDQVYLAYFGTAVPEGYGISYVPLPSFLPLQPKALPEKLPKYAVVSATLLAGQYLTQDVYAAARKDKPYRILGNSMYVFRADQ